MSSTKQPTGIKAMPPKREAPDVPQFFRLNVEVGDLDAAILYETTRRTWAEAAGARMLLRLWPSCPASAGCVLARPAAPSGKGFVLYCQ